MRRYVGEDLPSNPRIAVLTNDNLGNFVVATPLMQMLKERHAGTIAYLGGPRVAELATASEIVDEFVPVLGRTPRSVAFDLLKGHYDLVVNIEASDWAKAATALAASDSSWVCGPSLGWDCRSDLDFEANDRGALWQDPDWQAPDLTARYPFLDSSWLGEIFCRLAYLAGEPPGYRLPSALCQESLPEAWLSCSASLPGKLWPESSWLEAAAGLSAFGLRVGVLGAKPSDQARYWTGSSAEEALVSSGVEDWRGRLSLPQVVGAVEAARLVLTLDNGIMHVACATSTPVVALFREGVHRLWAPPRKNLTALHPGVGEAVSAISAENVLSACKAALSRS